MQAATTYTVRAYAAHGARFASVESSAGHDFTVLCDADETPAEALRRYARQEQHRARMAAERAATYEAAAEQAA